MAAMNQRKLVVLLNDFKENRRMSSESEAMLKPFWGMPFSFIFIFESASKTFSQKYGTQFAGGKTVVAKIIDSELMCSVLFSTGQNDWLCGLSAGQKFKKKLYCLVLIISMTGLFLAIHWRLRWCVGRQRLKRI